MIPRAVSPARASTSAAGPRAARLASAFARQVRWVWDDISGHLRLAGRRWPAGAQLPPDLAANRAAG